MAIDAPPQNGLAPPPPQASSPPPAAPAPAAPILQLTQARAPLEDAAEVLGTADAEGRQPIVLIPSRATRIRTDMILAGLVVLAIAIIVDLSLALRAALGVLAVGLVVMGFIRALILSVPEGAQAVQLRRGRFLRTVGPGVHFVRPGIVVSHVVTTRDTPFDAPAIEVPTSDDVRINIDSLVTFRIVAPERFVFLISASDFDQVCQATCQEAIRLLVRAKESGDILDIGDKDTERLRDQLGVRLDPYGVEVVRVVLTHVMPPSQFVASHESRRLARLQRAEEAELHALALLREADREALARQQIRARREEIELEADNDAARLERLESTIRNYPAAMRWDVDSQRLDVARALAANTRAMLQVGTAADLAGALLMQTHPDQTHADRGAAPDALPEKSVAS
jgi:regulator of protease activity HflC (stomatin/prohibitin superfamily)